MVFSKVSKLFFDKQSKLKPALQDAEASLKAKDFPWFQTIVQPKEDAHCLKQAKIQWVPELNKARLKQRNSYYILVLFNLKYVKCFIFYLKWYIMCNV